MVAQFSIAAKIRYENEKRALLLRESRAWEVARNAALLLKERFGATQVVAFGSLIHKGCFTPWSDVDIAAWGISPENTFRAISALIEIDSQIEVNLVDVSTCHISLLSVIEKEGVEI